MSSHGIQIPAQMDPNGNMKMPYCPGRDFVNCYPGMLRSIVKYFNSDKWPELLNHVAKLQGCTREEAGDLVCDANDAFFAFLSGCCQDPNETYDDVMEKAGWTKLPQPARFGYLALLGCVTSGQLFAGLRDVSMAGEVPPQHIKPLMDFYYDEARRCENKIKQDEEAVIDFKMVVKACRDAGLSYNELTTVLSDCKLGR